MVILQIEINSSTENKPVSLREISAFPEEDEYLMQLNGFLIITNIESKSEFTYITAQISNFKTVMSESKYNLNTIEIK